MSLDWQNERFIKVYTRDTADWLALSWDAQCLFLQILRKVDKAGFLDLGKRGKKGVAITLGALAVWESRIEPALEELLADGCVGLNGTQLFVPNFVEAQEARKSNAQAQRDFKEARRAQQAHDAELTNGSAATGNEPKWTVMAGNSPEQNRTEQNRFTTVGSDGASLPTDAGVRPSEPEPKPEPTKPALDAPIPADGTPARRLYDLLTTDTQLAAIIAKPADLATRLADPEAYPAINVLATVKAAATWLAANPKNRKANGARFLANWLQREQERAPRAGAVLAFGQPQRPAPRPLGPPKITEVTGPTTRDMTPEQRAELRRTIESKLAAGGES